MSCVPFTPFQSPAQFLKTLSRAKSTARRAVKVARTFPADLPHALRELGVIAQTQGDHPRAQQLLAESLEVAQQHKARYEQALTELFAGYECPIEFVGTFVA